MGDYESRAADHIAELIAEDLAERDYLNGHEWCTGHECDLEDDVTDCPYYMDNAQAMEDRQDDE